jgi:hypothetical protein
VLAVVEVMVVAVRVSVLSDVVLLAGVGVGEVEA